MTHVQFLTNVSRMDPQADLREIAIRERKRERAREPPLPLLKRISTHVYTGRELFWIDLTAVVFFGVLTGLILARTPPRIHGEGIDLLAWIGSIGTGVVVLFRRRFPWATFVLVIPTALAGIVLRAMEPPSFYMVMALYSVIVVSEPWTGRMIGVALLAADIACAVLGGGTTRNPTASTVFGTAALVLLGWLAAENTRASRIYTAYRAERAAAETAALEAEHAERSRRAILDERVVIARELHDIVAHTMSVIAVRAGVARAVLATHPAEAGEALGIVETTARRSLSELRLMVSMLRSSGGAKPDLGPLPGLDDLERLVAQIQAAGVDVELTVAGTVRPLSPVAELTAYRIVQEALTNVVRHAGPTRARVSISYAPDQLSIEVHDDGAAPDRTLGKGLQAAGTGHGLIGMKERVAMFGGTLEAGPDDAGFHVTARLNVDG